jgi:hypothetical protein
MYSEKYDKTKPRYDQAENFCKPYRIIGAIILGTLAQIGVFMGRTAYKDHQIEMKCREVMHVKINTDPNVIHDHLGINRQYTLGYKLITAGIVSLKQECINKGGEL